MMFVKSFECTFIWSSALVAIEIDKVRCYENNESLKLVNRKRNNELQMHTELKHRFEIHLIMILYDNGLESNRSIHGLTLIGAKCNHKKDYDFHFVWWQIFSINQRQHIALKLFHFVYDQKLNMVVFVE